MRMPKGLRRVLIAFIALIVLVFAVLLLFSRQPIAILSLFILKPFTNTRLLRTILDAAAPQLLCGLGVAVTFRAGLFSLAGEAQVYIGMLASAVLAKLAEQAGLSPAIVLGAGLSAGVLASLAATLPIAAVGRLERNNVLLISFMVSQGLVFLIDGFIAGPFRDSSNNLVATPMFAARLPQVPFLLNTSMALVLAVIINIIMWFVMERTAFGLTLTMYGRNERYALLQGYSTGFLSWFPLMLSGALHGLAGSLMVSSSYGRVIRGLSGGMGWNAIDIALIAANKPAYIPVAALLFSWLDTMTQYTVALGDLSFSGTDRKSGV